MFDEKKIEEIIIAHKDILSCEQIADKIAEECDMIMSGEQVARWLRKKGITKEKIHVSRCPDMHGERRGEANPTAVHFSDMNSNSSITLFPKNYKRIKI